MITRMFGLKYKHSHVLTKKTTFTCQQQIDVCVQGTIINFRVMLFGRIKWDAFDALSTCFFFSYQLFKLNLPTYSVKLPINCGITLHDILHSTS